jgi:spermidine synthase
LRHFKPDFQKTLIIGGAGYSFPKEYLRKYPGKQIDVVEIDPQMTQIARDHFRLKDDANLRIFHEDGRIFLNRTADKYDAILIDAFGSIYSVPFQLTTVEAVRKMSGALADDGVVILNLISAIEGEKSGFLQSEYKTFAEVFPSVVLFNLSPDRPNDKTRNLILVASKSGRISFDSSDAELSDLLGYRREKPLNLTMPVLTDDLAPVEYYNSFAQQSAGAK